jgi:hypothetical protein
MKSYLPTLKFRRLRGDRDLQNNNRKICRNNTLVLKLSNAKKSGNQYKLYQTQSKYDISKYFFTELLIFRIACQIMWWNWTALFQLNNA